MGFDGQKINFVRFTVCELSHFRQLFTFRGMEVRNQLLLQFSMDVFQILHTFVNILKLCM